MNTEKINLKYFVPLVFGLFGIISYCDYKREKRYNVYKCETEKLELNGIIDGVNHKSGYMQAHVKGMKNWFSLNISERKYSKGFPEYYSYEIGDSLMKKANSLEFTIKKEDKKAIYLLDCEK